jgi:Recombinase zinc beta ribbon domain
VRRHHPRRNRRPNRRASPPREGPALLQRLVLCGRCGKRMTVRYHSRNGVALPEYFCQCDGIEDAGPGRARISGDRIDAAVSELLLATVTPLVLDAALQYRPNWKTGPSKADLLHGSSVLMVGATIRRPS